MNKTYQTGETDEGLHQKYNPEGSQMWELQHRLLDMLLYLENICKELNIPIYIDGGTCLGAVRHGGFIPWDDDLDVVIDRKYYKKLCDYLLKHPHPKYILHNRQTDHNYYLGWAKLRDRNSSSVYYGSDEAIASQERIFKYTGIGIDLFVYSDCVIPLISKGIHGIHHRITQRYLVGKCKFLADLLYWCCFNILKPIANLLGFLFSDRKTIAHDYLSNNSLHRFQKDKVYPLSPIEFEGHTFMAPHDTDYFLRTLYGNYMCVPPESARHHHDLEFKLQPYEDNHSLSGGNE